MSEDNKTDDWEMSLPHQKLDEEAREVIDDNAPPPDSEIDYGHTAANINLESIASGPDDWGAADAPITTEEKVSEWSMPEPVFRVSPGETPQFERHQILDGDDFSEGYAPRQARSSEPEPSAPDLTAPRPQARSGGSGKWILLLGGMGALMIVALAVLGGAYLFWFNRGPDTAATSANKAPGNNDAKSAPTPVSKPESSPSLPASINHKGEMVLVAPGEFTMGSDTGPEESRPAHKVNVDAFYIDKYEVTNAKYKEFCDATKRAYPATQPWDENYFIARPDAPVVGVSFEDARAYADWAGKRLPNEKEWEKAASWDGAKKTKSSYPWGDEFDAAKCAFGLGSPSDVGRFPGGTSPSGAYDMAGNAMEWVDEFFSPYPGSNFNSSEFGDKRVVRGGFVSSKSNDFLMATKRVFVPPGFVPNSDRDSFIGFRCVLRASDPAFREIVKADSN